MKKIIFILFFLLTLTFLLKVKVPAQSSRISNLTQNSTQIPLWEKFELTFDINQTSATNLQWPYDTSPPPGLEGQVGITVDGLFLPPGESNWANAYIQPGFWYQEMDRVERGSMEWLYPLSDYKWKIRFSPNKTGTWQYKVKIDDTDGSWESQVYTFDAQPAQPGVHGFIRNSLTDGRYFEFSDGTLFWGSGHQHNAHVNSFDNERDFQSFQQKGLNLLRIWMTGNSVYGAAWQPWASRTMGFQNQWPRVAQIAEQNIPGGTYKNNRWALHLSSHDDGSPQNPIMFQGWSGKYASAKPSTWYEVTAIVKTDNFDGPIDPNYDYGFTISQASRWIGDADIKTPYPDESILIDDSGSPIYVNDTNGQWQIITGRFQTAANQYGLRYTYLKLENTLNGVVFIDKVEIREVLSGDQRGENVLIKSDFNVQNYYDQYNSLVWDKVIEAAEQNDIFLKIVILEKLDPIFTSVDENGNSVVNPTGGEAQQYWNNFYSHDNTYVRRLHKYWWRYLKARWGYSRAIHSWELLNEGDPANGLHYSQTQTMAEYMDNYGSEKQMTSTSFWHSFPLSQFWGNANYQGTGYYDIHGAGCFSWTDPQTGQEVGHDAALYHYSHAYCAYKGCGSCSSIDNHLTSNPAIQRKPLIKGEAYIMCSEAPADLTCPGLENDTRGVWLHNFVWAQVQPNTLYEILWIQRDLNDHDLRWEYGRFRNFLNGIPLNNGFYQDAQATSTNGDLRAWGQKDTTNHGLHLWIQNKNHTWKNVTDGINIPSEQGNVTVNGFTPGKTVQVEWWNTWTGQISSTENQTVNAQGELAFDIPVLADDLALRILAESSPSPSITATPTPSPQSRADVNGDKIVNLADIQGILFYWGQTCTNQEPACVADVNDDKLINIADIAGVIFYWGQIIP